LDWGYHPIDGMYAFEIPAYNPGGVRNNIVQMVNTDKINGGGHTASNGLSVVALSVVMPASSTGSTTGNFYRSAGDDHNLSRFCGIVPLVASTVA